MRLIVQGSDSAGTGDDSAPTRPPVRRLENMSAVRPEPAPTAEERIATALQLHPARVTDLVALRQRDAAELHERIDKGWQLLAEMDHREWPDHDTWSDQYIAIVKRIRLLEWQLADLAVSPPSASCPVHEGYFADGIQRNCWRCQEAEFTEAIEQIAIAEGW